LHSALSGWASVRNVEDVMSSKGAPPLYMSEDGLRIDIEPSNPESKEMYEALIHKEDKRCHPDDTLDDLKHRARFSKESQGLLRDWMAVAANLARQHRSVVGISLGQQIRLIVER
jgi:hypothetical protein